MKSKLAENIRVFRKERKITQEQLAQAMGVSVGAVYKWESNQSTPELSIIMKLAELFDISMDVLTGYAKQSGNMETAFQKIITLRENMQFEDGTAEAERALKKYPNCFDIVYQSALLYYEKGYDKQDRRTLSRALELLEFACSLIDQNTDDSVSEISIRNLTAQVHLRLGNKDKCLELLKRYNACGINNAMIGMVLADVYHKTDEAAVYLTKAFVKHIDDLNSLMVGFVNVFAQKGAYKTALVCVQWWRSALRSGGNDEKLTPFEKYDCVLLALCAEFHCMIGDEESARECLREAAGTALRFDCSNENETHSSDLFDALGVKQKNYDFYGKTALEAIDNRIRIDAEIVPQLPVIWKEIRKEAVE